MSLRTPSVSRVLVVVIAAFGQGCGSSPAPEAPPPCDERAKVDGVCPGVTSAEVTADGASCSVRIDVTPSDVTTKAASAASGSCLLLAPGSYGPITLPAGVSLIGRGQAGTSVLGIVVVGGSVPSLVRGVAVKGGGIAIKGPGSLLVDRVRVFDATGAGISATSADLSIVNSTIENGKGVGVRSDCASDCKAARPKLSLRSVLVRKNRSAGVWAHGADTTLLGVQIEGTQALDFRWGRGLEIAKGGSLKGSNLAVLENDDVGIYVDGATADISSFVSSRNQRGVQLQAIPEGGAKLSTFEIVDNKALGIGITRAAKGIVVVGGRVASTKMVNMPVDLGGVEGVGDGINWLEGSEVTIESSVRIESSERRPLIIENTAKGKFAGVLGGGDEGRGVVVQGGEGTMPSELSLPAGVKADVLAKSKAMPVAVPCGLSDAP